jgi:PAS domain S-box-containing protein
MSRPVDPESEGEGEAAPELGERIAAAASDACEFEARAQLVLVVGRDSLLLHASHCRSMPATTEGSDALGLPLLEAIRAWMPDSKDRLEFERGIAAALGEPASNAPIFLRLRHRQDDPRYLEGRVYGPRAATGNFVVVFHDRTAELHEIADLVEDERRFRMVAAAAQDMVTETSEAGDFTYVSPACTDVLGYPEQELVGHSPLRLHHPDDTPVFLDELNRTTEAGRPFHVTPHRLRKRDGSWIWAEATGVRYRRADGQLRIIGVARDITDRVEQEATRRLLEDQVRHAQKLESLGILAGGIAHDFNNLLTPIIGAAGLLANELSGDPAPQRLVETIRKAAARATDLASQMLSYAGKNEPKFDRVDLSDVIRDMQLLLESAASPGSLLEYGLDPGPVRARADKTQVGQVVMNLVVNAAEALSGAGGHIRISTGTIDADRALLDGYQLGSQREQGRYAYLEVRDDGVGIEDQTRERIFDPFFSTKFTGRGLGLAVVLGIVQRHAGALRVESKLGEGTSFRVLLPAICDGVDDAAGQA